MGDPNLQLRALGRGATSGGSSGWRRGKGSNERTGGSKRSNQSADAPVAAGGLQTIPLFWMHQKFLSVHHVGHRAPSPPRRARTPGQDSRMECTTCARRQRTDRRGISVYGRLASPNVHRNTAHPTCTSAMDVLSDGLRRGSGTGVQLPLPAPPSAHAMPPGRATIAPNETSEGETSCKLRVSVHISHSDSELCLAKHTFLREKTTQGRERSTAARSGTPRHAATRHTGCEMQPPPPAQATERSQINMIPTPTAP